MRDAILHLVTPSADPRVGGMEASVLRIAAHLAAAGAEVNVHALHDDDEAAARAAVSLAAGVTLLPLGETRRVLAEPIDAATSSLPFENYQLDHALLRSAVHRSLRESPAARHLLVSFFVTYAGWIAHRLADELGIGHLAAVRGSDLTRDHHDPFHAPGFAEVVRGARRVVVTNGQHEQVVRRIAGAAPVEVIPNAVEIDGEPWAPAGGSEVRLVSDCGYSFRKGTHVLVRAAARLADDGAPVRLSIVGPPEPARRAYWDDFRARRREHPALDLRGRIDADQVEGFLRRGDVYCSATLGEGSSRGRLLAAALGMPMVTTRCGTLADLAGDLAHVRLVEVADVEGFEAALGAAVSAARDGTTTVDGAFVEALREALAPARERDAWVGAVTAALELP